MPKPPPSRSYPLAAIHTYPEIAHKFGLRALDDVDRPFESQRLMLLVCENPELTYAVLGKLAQVNMQDGMKLVYGPTDRLRRAHARFRRADVPSMRYDSIDVKGAWGEIEARIGALHSQSGGTLGMAVVEDISVLSTPPAKVLQGAKTLARRKNIAVAMGITSVQPSWKRGERLRLDKIGTDLGAEDLILHLRLPKSIDDTAVLDVVRARHTAETTYPVSWDELRSLVVVDEASAEEWSPSSLLRATSAAAK